MLNLIGFICVVVLSLFYHWFVLQQAKTTGFEDHYKIDSKILVFGVIKFVLLIVLLAVQIANWEPLYIWIPMTLFTALWFVFSLTTLTKKLTPKDESYSFIGSILVLAGSVAIIILQFLGTGV